MRLSHLARPLHLVRRPVPLLVMGWAVAMGVGMAAFMRHDYTPTAAAAPASNDWPSGLGLDRDRHRPTLVVVLHPLCPCSRATVTELADLAQQAGDRLTIYVVFSVLDGLPADAKRSVTQSALWQSASAIAGVRPVVDAGGRIASRLDARSSGQTYLFDVNGHLRFAGGITPGRGLVGPNDGVFAIEAATGTTQLTLSKPPPTTTPVYGCSIR